MAVRKTPRRVIGIPDLEWFALLALAEENGTTASEIIRNAIRETLAQHGKPVTQQPGAAAKL